MNKIIALDIDGTLVDSSNSLNEELVVLLSDLFLNGCKIIFITGRNFASANKILKKMPFPYHVAVHNGALTVKMPEEKVVQRQYIEKSIVSKVEKICKDYNTDCIIYGGFEFLDRCLYRPENIPCEILHHLKERRTKEKWETITSFDSMLFTSFPSLKIFGTSDFLMPIKEQLELLGLYVPIIKDPYNLNYCIAQVTVKNANKGRALKEFVEGQKGKSYVIAAGDDYNDIPMLEQADFKIVMDSAPSEMFSLADSIALPLSQGGILSSLKNMKNKISAKR